jgi:hypothetical protein
MHTIGSTGYNMGKEFYAVRPVTKSFRGFYLIG